MKLCYVGTLIVHQNVYACFTISRTIVSVMFHYKSFKKMLVVATFTKWLLFLGVSQTADMYLHYMTCKEYWEWLT